MKWLRRELPSSLFFANPHMQSCTLIILENKIYFRFFWFSCAEKKFIERNGEKNTERRFALR